MEENRSDNQGIKSARTGEVGEEERRGRRQEGFLSS